MALENPWVGYLQRSYKSIKASILSRMKVVVPEVTDHSESNIFVIIINLFAGLIEQLNYYIDNLARESNIITARRYSSLIKLTRIIDYRVKAKIGSTVDIKIVAVDSNGDPVILENDFSFNSGLIVKVGAIEFITQRKATIFKNSTYVITGARQAKKVIDEIIGVATSAADQAFSLNEDYQDGTLQITISALTWQLVDTFTFSGPQDKHFIVEVNQDKQAFVVFGNDINGAIPPNGENILGTYFTCLGINGNVETGDIDTFDSPPTPPANTPTIDHFTVVNELPAVGGQNEEDIDSIRRNATLSLRTLNRAVTLQDHKDIALLVPGVGKADAFFDPRLKSITFFIAPDGGGTASAGLLLDVEDFFESRKMISTVVNALPTGETKLRMTINATVRFRRNTVAATQDIKEALQESFGFNNSDINKHIRRSDIIALIDNLDKIDYLSLDILTTKPYPRPNSGVGPLENNWLVEVQSSSVEIAEWRIAVIDASNARIWRKGPSGVESYQGQITIHVTNPGNTDFTSADGTLKIAMWGSYSVGDEWSFSTYPYNQDQVINDYTIPIYDEDELTLIVNKQVGL